MLLSWIYGKLNKSQKEDFIFGLFIGLFFTVTIAVAGAVAGTVTIAVAVAGAVTIAIAGAVAGSGFIFVLYGLATGRIELLPFLIIVVVASEVAFWLDGSKPSKGEGKMWFTAKAKLENLFESSIIIGNLMNVFSFRQDIADFFVQANPAIVEGLKWLGIIAVVIIVAYAFVWANSLKFRNAETPNRITRGPKK